MKVLNTEHKRKSAILTILILILLLFGVFNYGMKYLDPPEEYGVAINFGSSNVGSGAPIEKTKQIPKAEEVEESKEEKVEEVSKESVEEIITKESFKEVPIVEKKEKPKPSKATTDALNSLLKGNSKKGELKGEGDDKELGVKGDKNGDPSSSKYYGNGGKGSGGNYNLAGRKALSKPIEKPNCEQEGRVVVSIEVNKDGKVIKAVPGVKGSTNTHPCLLRPAKEAALRTKWNADGEAPQKQKGTIIYNFSLSK
ncbi:energy transducer TonB [Tenacibaculum maritimum]|uniref:energy transducer TonB n=1 Tax=Tenacibaculum maritimum TaxID=107401 RepID=UPI00388FA57D